jgi:hypothetical protein
MDLGGEVEDDSKHFKLIAVEVVAGGSELGQQQSRLPKHLHSPKGCWQPGLQEERRRDPDASSITLQKPT